MTKADLGAAAQCTQNTLFVVRATESIGLKVRKQKILEVDNKGASPTIGALGDASNT